MSRRLWPVAILVATVFLIPMRRYEIPVQLPIHLEPYRPLVALVVGGWILALLMMTVRLRRTNLDAPLAALVGVVVLSVVANPARVIATQAEVLKFLSLFATFVLTFFIFTSIVRTLREIDYVVRLIVVLGTIVAVLAIVESRTGFSPFAHLERVVPMLRPLPAELIVDRGGRLRAFGSAEHPIALGALLVMVSPFAIYLAVTTRRFVWWACGVALVVGALSTVSRTAVVMLGVILIAFAVVRWQDVRRHWIMILPILAVVHFMSPGTLGVIRSSFQPAGGLVAEQSGLAESGTSGGRVSDLAPSLEEFEKKPVLGDGMGTRIVIGEDANGRLLDNQWLGLLIDSGLAGVLAFLWLVLRFARGQLALARAIPGAAGYLPLACASSVLAYAVGMFTYDSFSFTQVTFMFFIVLGIGASLHLAGDLPALVRTAPSLATGARAAPVTPSSLQPVP